MDNHKVAVLTAAGTGMGADAAKKLASKGFKVSILSSSGKGELLANDLGGIGVTGSNQSENDLKKLVDATLGNWGRIDVLVNSAGHGPRGPVLDITDDDWQQGMETYFLNVVRATRLVTPMPPKSFASCLPFPDEDKIEILKPLDAKFFAASAPIPVPAAVKTATL